MPAIELIRPLRLTPTGGTELTILNRGSNNVFYGQSSLVSSTNKTGTIAVNESLTLKTGFVWVVAEATPVIVDLKEVEVNQGGGTTGITKKEVEEAFQPLPEIEAATLTVTTAKIELGTIFEATVYRIILKASPIIEMPPNTNGSSIIVELEQDNAGSRIPTFQTKAEVAVKWPEATLPTFSTAAKAVDILTFYCINKTWYGFFPGKGMG